MEFGPNKEFDYEPGVYTLWAESGGIKLAKGEGLLLEMFLGRPKQIFTRSEIMDRLNFDLEADDRNVDGLVKRLRQRLRKVEALFIHTQYGIGYYWDDSSQYHPLQSRGVNEMLPPRPPKQKQLI